jgi:hypothetical protein
LDVECVIAPTVQVQGSFADLEGLHALLDALSGPAATVAVPSLRIFLNRGRHGLFLTSFL